jgi:hypothetical protein
MAHEFMGACRLASFCHSSIDLQTSGVNLSMFLQNGFFFDGKGQKFIFIYWSLMNEMTLTL